MSSPGVLLRQVTCTVGSVTMELSYAPCPEYGLIHPVMTPVPGEFTAYGGAHLLVMSTPVPLEAGGSTGVWGVLADGRAAPRLRPARRGKSVV